jgi:hypothetical protein
MNDELCCFALIKQEGRYVQADRCVTGPAFTGYDAYPTEIPFEEQLPPIPKYHNSMSMWWMLPAWVERCR